MNDDEKAADDLKSRLAGAKVAAEVAAKRFTTSKARSVVDRLELVWRDEVQAAWPGARTHKWVNKERAQIKTLLAKVDGDEGIVIDTICFLIRMWPDVNNRFFKGAGSVPTPATLHRLANILILDAQIWSKWQVAEKEHSLLKTTESARAMVEAKRAWDAIYTSYRVRPQNSPARKR